MVGYSFKIFYYHKGIDRNIAAAMLALYKLYYAVSYRNEQLVNLIVSLYRFIASSISVVTNESIECETIIITFSLIV